MSKKKPARKKDYHRSQHLVRIPPNLFAAMKELADESDRPLTREIARALTAYLQSKGKLPPSGTPT